MEQEHEIEKIILNNKEVEIDRDCVPIVRFFNKIGLLTKFSCQCQHGRFFIMFHESVTDEDIFQFILKVDKHHEHNFIRGKFEKWGRKVDNKILCNWQYQAKNSFEALIDLVRWEEVLHIEQKSK